MESSSVQGRGGDTLAADDVNNVKIQRVKLVQGADGSNDGDVSSAAPLNVTMANAALTAAVYALTATMNSSSLMDGLTAMTPKFAAISITSAGENNTLVAAVAGKKIRVLAFAMSGGTLSGTVRFEDGAGGTALTGAMPLGDNSSTTNTNGGNLQSVDVNVFYFHVNASCQARCLQNLRLYLVHLHHFVAVVVYDLDGDLARLRFGKWAALGRIQIRPCGLVDLGPQGAL